MATYGIGAEHGCLKNTALFYEANYFRPGFTESCLGRGIRHHVHLLADWCPRMVGLQNGKVVTSAPAFPAAKDR